MKTVITYGTYDLLHQGHINLLRRAKALGDYLIVGVTNDNFDRERGKLNVQNNVLERVEAVKATGLDPDVCFCFRVCVLYHPLRQYSGKL